MASAYPNPLKEILHLIPYTETVLDEDIFDKIRIVLIKHDKANVLDNYISLLLAFLAEHDLLKMTIITPVSVIGKITLIKKI